MLVQKEVALKKCLFSRRRLANAAMISTTLRGVIFIQGHHHENSIYQASSCTSDRSNPVAHKRLHDTP
jgi:hypothetical protein